ncbi:hypothetical protein [Nonomuraea sp. NPDC049709]|uniref:hypothetical protein n=1 Tax=Nonomuraea sp. NPDC049709 TaxID=3154736 RepID=UPI003428E90E
MTALAPPVKSQSSGELKGLRDEPKDLQASWGFDPWVRENRRGLFLGVACQERFGVLGVADGGLGIQAERRREVERVGSVGEGFLELAIGA